MVIAMSHRGLLSLTLANLRGVGERICHALPDVCWNFNAVPAWPGHERNLMIPYFIANGGNGIAESQDLLSYHAAVFGLSLRDLESSCAQSVTMENKASKAGVVRKIALSDHWR
jgi:hypothetical protein